jgi:hypothetical protein
MTQPPHDKSRPNRGLGLPFHILATGRFDRAHLRIRHVDEARATTPEIERLIDEEWTRQTALAKLNERLLFNGDMLRYMSHKVIVANDAESCLDLVVGPTCYRDFVGTNLYHGDRVLELGWHRFANPIGTTATLRTADGRIAYGLRSQRVSFHAGHVHTFGGGLEASDRHADGSIDAFASVSRELKEELNLDEHELHDLVCVGLIRDTEIHQPEMLFEARVDLPIDDLRRRWASAESMDEHIAIVELDDQPSAVAPFIRSCELIAPVAFGALAIHGKLAWGDEWFRAFEAEFL